MILHYENSCTHEFTQIGQQFIMPCGWDYGGQQGKQPASTFYQWNLVAKPYPCRVHVSNCVSPPPGFDPRIHMESSYILTLL